MDGGWKGERKALENERVDRFRHGFRLRSPVLRCREEQVGLNHRREPVDHGLRVTAKLQARVSGRTCRRKKRGGALRLLPRFPIVGLFDLMKVHRPVRQGSGIPSVGLNRKMMSSSKRGVRGLGSSTTPSAKPAIRAVMLNGPTRAAGYEGASAKLQPTRTVCAYDRSSYERPSKGQGLAEQDMKSGCKGGQIFLA